MFALGSTLFEIFSGSVAPYAELGSEEVRALFENGEWPDLEGIKSCDVGAGHGGHGDWAEIILGCWEGRFEGAEQILGAVSGTAAG